MPTVYDRLKTLQITLPDTPPSVVDGYVAASREQVLLRVSRITIKNAGLHRGAQNLARGEALRRPERRAVSSSVRKGRRYVSSMPKLGATGAKTNQLELVSLQVFRGFSRRLLVRVSAGIALITRRSSVQI
jgi:hypothetical protein